MKSDAAVTVNTAIRYTSHRLKPIDMVGLAPAGRFDLFRCHPNARFAAAYAVRSGLHRINIRCG
jgi:hypothetical protein